MLFDILKLHEGHFYLIHNFSILISCRWNKISDWERSPLAIDLEWKEIVEPIMKLYTESTDGSYVETKESALVWHHQDADPDFGSCQAKELLDHLEKVLANEPAVVKRGQYIVEVKPQVQSLSFTIYIQYMQYVILISVSLAKKCPALTLIQLQQR